MPTPWSKDPVPDSPVEDCRFGEDPDHDRTDELIEWVRVNFIEHHSPLADITHPEAIAHLVKLTIAGMSAFNPDDAVQFYTEDDEDTDEESPGEPAESDPF